MECRKGRFSDPVILPLHKRPPKITTLCGNLSVCRRHNNILHRRNDGFSNIPTKQCSSWTQEWCNRNSMVPNPEKCKQWSCSANQHLLALSNNIIKWTTSERLLGVQVDNKLSWSDHAAKIAKSFASKLSLLQRKRFLPQKQLEDFYTKVILPSVTYSLTVW